MHLLPEFLKSAGQPSRRPGEMKEEKANKWVELPQDLLERISNFGFTPDYILRMQFVCKSWRSILQKSMHRELPWLMLLPNNNKEEEDDPDARLFFSLFKKTTHPVCLPEIRGKRCCGSFQNGWLMTVDEKLDICLFHPWSKRKFELPHLSKLKNQPFEEEDLSMEGIRDLHITKTALSDDGKVLVVIYGIGFLAFCRIGDDAYTEIESGLNEMTEDVIYHKGRFYALSVEAGIHLLHIEEGINPHGEKLTIDLSPRHSMFFGYLVPDLLTDTMFVIIRDIDFIEDTDKPPKHQTYHFHVYRVTLEEGAHDRTLEEGAQDRMLKELTKVESLGDRVLFLGHNSSIIVIASQFPGFKGNRIYFADTYMESYITHPYGCHDLGVYSLEDGTIERLFSDRFHPIWSPPLWIAIPPYSSQRYYEERSLEESCDVLLSNYNILR